jgi:hypothetical protein
MKTFNEKVLMKRELGKRCLKTQTTTGSLDVILGKAETWGMEFCFLCF